MKKRPENWIAHRTHNTDKTQVSWLNHELDIFYLSIARSHENRKNFEKDTSMSKLSAPKLDKTANFVTQLMIFSSFDFDFEFFGEKSKIMAT